MSYQMYCFLIDILKNNMKNNLDNNTYYSRFGKEVLKGITDVACEEIKKHY